MDQRERGVDLVEALQTAMDGRQAELWTALPCLVESYDPAKLTVTCQPAVKVSLRQFDGSFKWVDMPLLLDVPVVFPSGGGFIVTFPLQTGDEVLVVFASRCIDGWWDQGGVQLPPELRFHDLSDGFALPGPRSQVRLPSGVDTTNLRIQKDDGSVSVEITPTGSIILNPGAAGVTINGDLHVTGEVTAKTLGTPIPLSAHLHPGVTSGGANTGGPIP